MRIDFAGKDGSGTDGWNVLDDHDIKVGGPFSKVSTAEAASVLVEAEEEAVILGAGSIAAKIRRAVGILETKY